MCTASCSRSRWPIGSRAPWRKVRSEPPANSSSPELRSPESPARMAVKATSGRRLPRRIPKPAGFAVRPPGSPTGSKTSVKVRADALEKQLEKHRQRLEESEIAFLAAADRMRAPRERAERGEAMVAMHDFARLADATPVLDASNLHEFRKSVKKARYVAESSGDDGSSQTVAGALKRIQDAIGAWHDWLCLSRGSANRARRRWSGADVVARDRDEPPFRRTRSRSPNASVESSWESGWQLETRRGSGKPGPDRRESFRPVRSLGHPPRSLGPKLKRSLISLIFTLRMVDFS